MIEWLGISAFVFTLIALLWASITDIKERLVDDRIPVALVVIGIILYLTAGIFFSRWEWLFFGAIIAGITFAAAYFLWRIGFWAGGDVKLFAGIAFLNPFNWAGISGLIGENTFFSISSDPIFPFSLFVFSVIALLPVGLGMGFFKLFKKPEQLKNIFPNPLQKIIGIALFSLFIIGSEIVLKKLGLSSFIVLALIVLFGLVPAKIRKILGIGFGLTGIFFSGQSFAGNAIQLFTAVLAVFLVFKLLFSLRKLFRIKKQVLQLKEGDIPAVDIIETKNGIEIREEKSLLEMLKNQKKQGLLKNIPETTRTVCSSRRAGGLEKEQIQELIALFRQKKIPEEITLKESTAFVPAILVAYLFLNIIGNPLWLLI